MAAGRRVNAIAAVLFVCTLSELFSPLAWAEEERESAGTQIATFAASPVLTAVHVPLKAALCATAVVTGGLAYLLTFGSEHVPKDALKMIKGVCTGPYIITPERLRADGE